MISAFWDALFKYGDDLKKRKGFDSNEYKVYNDICKMLQIAYDNGEKYKEVKFDFQPRTPDEAQIFDITGLGIFVDPNDGDYMYELDKRHFDTPSEVIQALIDDRELRYSRMRSGVINKVKKWWKMKADSLYYGTPCQPLEEFIEGSGKKKNEDKGKTEKEADDQ